MKEKHKLVKEHIAKIKAEIFPVKLVVVTKGQDTQTLKALLDCDITDIGENRIQDFEERFTNDEGLYKELKSKNVNFHFIGRLQSNKVKSAVQYFDMIQSVDSIKLLKKIDKEAAQQQKTIDVLLQINISNDNNKQGFLKEDIDNVLKENLSNVEIKGLMTILKKDLNKAQIEKYYEELTTLTKSYNLKVCSAGMSDDYKIAIKKGANMVRIGSKIFK